jgi:hypothetical protein
MIENEYPIDDDKFTEETLRSVNKEGNTVEDCITLELESGFSYFLDESLFEGVDLKPGDKLRFYGPSPVRGIFKEGKKLFYQTAQEYLETSRKKSYKETAEDWLKAWDDGETVWSVEMGGMGPAYEQAIQVLAAETLRHFIKTKPDFESDEGLKNTKEAYEKWSFEDPIVKKIGPTGAMMGGARNLASNFYRRGPYKALSDEAVADRKIQVQKVIDNPYA